MRDDLLETLVSEIVETYGLEDNFYYSFCTDLSVPYEESELDELDFSMQE